MMRVRFETTPLRTRTLIYYRDYYLGVETMTFESPLGKENISLFALCVLLLELSEKSKPFLSSILENLYLLLIY